MNSRCKGKPARGFTLLELLVAVAIVIVLAGITFQVTTSMVESANLTRATQKIKDLGQSFVDYTSDHGGRLPLENADVPNISADDEDWTVAASEEAGEAWYNVLPERMGFPSVAELGADNAPHQFYDPAYPVFMRGAPYHKGDKKLERPYFSVGMNSRLQRRSPDGYKDPGTLASIQQPVNTVIFLERGLPKDEQHSKAQRKFNGSPKANPRAFATRHNQKGVLLFVDGHTEVRKVTELIKRSGEIIVPEDQQPGTSIIWTRDPDDDPNAEPED
ncbi:MAG: hypothetical protein CMN03_00455 [Roseibacillus sp.]|nr:hypothetical protein [Roseibacillus sp.]